MAGVVKRMGKGKSVEVRSRKESLDGLGIRVQSLENWLWNLETGMLKKKKGKIQVMLNIRGLAEEAYNF